MRNYYSWKRLDSEFLKPSTNIRAQKRMAKTPPHYGRSRGVQTPFCQRDPITNKPDPDIIIPDIPTLREIQAVRRQATGAIKASSGHDDHWDALLIALCAARDGWSGMPPQRSP